MHLQLSEGSPYRQTSIDPKFQKSFLPNLINYQAETHMSQFIAHSRKETNTLESRYTTSQNCVAFS